METTVKVPTGSIRFMSLKQDLSRRLSQALTSMDFEVGAAFKEFSSLKCTSCLPTCSTTKLYLLDAWKQVFQGLFEGFEESEHVAFFDLYRQVCRHLRHTLQKSASLPEQAQTEDYSLLLCMQVLYQIRLNSEVCLETTAVCDTYLYLRQCTA